MKREEKRIILTILVVTIMIIVGILILKNTKKGKEKDISQREDVQTEKYVDVLDDGTKLNKSNKLKETKKLDELEISRIQLTYSNGTAVILGNVKNTSNRDINLTPIVLTLYDEKGNILETLETVISPVKVGQTVQLNVGISADYANAYDFSVIKK